ncbi:hypothetical protein WAK64_19745 [Bacillus spongiae]|uniref:Uncharacterized protein n=1 Tax=Bacillus spongiae TaxID=2683610 RepID=A0ABU8HJA7_9BACI
MKKRMVIFFICVPFLLLLGMNVPQKLTISHIEITAKGQVLIYKVNLSAVDGSKVESQFDYQGNHIHGFELAVKPSESLAKHMEMNTKSKLMKMCPKRSGGSMASNGGWNLEVQYYIKEESNQKKVEKLARKESTLYIFDGTDKIIEHSLKD